jgi:hypothetical protein
MTVENVYFVMELSYCIMIHLIAYLIVRFGNPDDGSQDLFFRMLTFQVFRANPNATVYVISEEVLDGMSRASELRQSTQVISSFVSSLISS